MSAKSFDVIVIGAGPGGYVAAITITSKLFADMGSLLESFARP